MSYKKKTKHSQATLAAKADFLERTARRIDKGEHKINHSVRECRTRKDSFNGLFEQHIVPLLEDNPALQPVTLLVSKERTPIR